MDKFKSAIFVRDILSDMDGNTFVQQISHDLVNNDPLVEGSISDDDELYIDTQAWGWWDGGLAIMLTGIRELRPKNNDMYFRGAAMFENLDDAKNDYLMDPLQEVYRVKQVTEDQHVPFGVVIPKWVSKCQPGCDASDARSYRWELVSVTIILWWQELT